MRQPTSASLVPLLLLVGCRYFDAGVDRALAPLPDGAPVPDGDAGGTGDGAQGNGDQARPDAPPPSPEPPPGIMGAPAMVGCADGTREGFVDPAAWIHIAGCSGAWSVPGVRGSPARTPQCGRAAGNTGAIASGMGCSAADLCAGGWHVCEDGEDVRRSSPTECESAILPGYAAFFVTQAGATSYGLCAADPALENDLHGCGSFGQPELGGCQPLNRRLSFVECLGSRVSIDSPPVWFCGDAGHHLTEAALVTKSSAALGGVLCCRDP